MNAKETIGRCAAATRAGSRCKRLARPGEVYCAIHLKSAGEPASASSVPETEELRRIVQELEEFVAELKTAVPARSSTALPSMESDRIIQFLKDNLDKVAPELVKDLASSFEGATKEDLLDPETWKGLAYMLGYSMRFQADKLKQRLLGEEHEE